MHTKWSQTLQLCFPHSSQTLPPAPSHSCHLPSFHRNLWACRAPCWFLLRRGPSALPSLGETPASAPSTKDSSAHIHTITWHSSIACFCRSSLWDSDSPVLYQGQQASSVKGHNSDYLGLRGPNSVCQSYSTLPLWRKGKRNVWTQEHFSTSFTNTKMWISITFTCREIIFLWFSPQPLKKVKIFFSLQAI